MAENVAREIEAVFTEAVKRAKPTIDLRPEITIWTQFRNREEAEAYQQSSDDYEAALLAEIQGGEKCACSCHLSQEDFKTVHEAINPFPCPHCRPTEDEKNPVR